MNTPNQPPTLGPISASAQRIAERAIQIAIVTYLRKIGYFVIVTSTDGPQAASIAGMPDILAFKHDTVLLIEVKTPTGNLRPSQQVFQGKILEHTGKHVQYIVSRSMDDVIKATGAS